MMATGIRQRHGRECSRKGRCDCPYEASVYSKSDGKKIRRTFSTHGAAKQWRDDSRAAVAKKAMRVAASTTVREAADELLAGMRDGSIPTRSRKPYKPATIRSYDEALTLRVLSAFGHKRLADVEREDVQRFADRLTADGLSASTVQNQIDPLRVIYRRAVRRKLVIDDPTKGLELRRPEGRRERIATPEEAQILLDALQADDRGIWATALYSGLRHGELRALRWDDVDLDAGVVRVSRGWDAKEGEQDVKTDAARRTVPLIGRLRPYLAAHKLATGRDGHDLVFGATADVPFEPSTVRRRALAAWGWKSGKNPEPDGPHRITVKAREDALEPVGLHDARHTFASLMIAAGVNAKALSVVMGHESVAFTFDVYGKLMPGGEDEARARIDSYLERLDGGPHLRAVGE
jgi:integrase